MKCEKYIYKYSIYYAIVINIIIVLVESLIRKTISFDYALCFTEGVIVNCFCFYLNIKAVDHILNNKTSRSKLFMVFINLLKLMIYAATMFISFRIYEFGLFACAFGLCTIKIMIYFKYLVIDNYYDKKMLIEELNLPESITKKLKLQNINKVLTLREKTKEELEKYLTENEINDLIVVLHKHEYFLKNELEAILENENDVNC